MPCATSGRDGMGSETLDTPSEDPPDARRPRALILAGAALAAGGVAVAGSLSPDLGGALLLAGWLALGIGIHRFGRLGVEDAREGKREGRA
jgi:hypothetical protein